MRKITLRLFKTVALFCLDESRFDRNTQTVRIRVEAFAA